MPFICIPVSHLLVSSSFISTCRRHVGNPSKKWNNCLCVMVITSMNCEPLKNCDSPLQTFTPVRLEQTSWRLVKAVSNAFVFMKRNTVWCHYGMVNFLTNIHKRHPIDRLLGWGMGCLLWIQHPIDILPQFLQLFMQYHIILDCVIAALDCICILILMSLKNIFLWLNWQ